MREYCRHLKIIILNGPTKSRVELPIFDFERRLPASEGARRRLSRESDKTPRWSWVNLLRFMSAGIWIVKYLFFSIRKRTLFLGLYLTLPLFNLLLPSKEWKASAGRLPVISPLGSFCAKTRSPPESYKNLNNERHNKLRNDLQQTHFRSHVEPLSWRIL